MAAPIRESLLMMPHAIAEDQPVELASAPGIAAGSRREARRESGHTTRPAASGDRRKQPTIRALLCHAMEGSKSGSRHVAADCRQVSDHLHLQILERLASFR